MLATLKLVSEDEPLVEELFLAPVRDDNRETTCLSLLVNQGASSSSPSLPRDAGALLDLVCRAFASPGASHDCLTAWEHLERVHEEGLIWTLPIPKEQPHQWARLLQLYFGIPDRIAAGSCLVGDNAVPLLRGRAFYAHLCRRIPPDGSLDRIVDFTKRFYLSGQLSLLVEALLSRSHLLFPAIIHCLSNLPSPTLPALIRELFGIANLLYAEQLPRLAAELARFQAALLPHITGPTRVSIFLDCPPAPFCCICYNLLIRGTLAEAELVTSLFVALLRLWSLPSTTQRMTLNQQRHLTKLVLIGLSTQNYESLQNHHLESWLLDGIQCRIDSADENTAIMGKVTAECFATLTPVERPLDFSLAEASAKDLRQWFSTMAHLDEQVLLAQHGSFAHHRRTFGAEDTFPPATREAAVELVEDHVLGEPPVPSTVGNDPLPNFRSLLTISEQDEIPRNAKTRPPAYLRDCLAYLRCADDPEKVRLAMQHAPALLCKSSRILQEEIGAELYRTVLYCIESFDLANFDDQRMALLGVLATSLPRVIGPTFVQEMTSRNSSLRQKLEATCSCIAAIRGQARHPLPAIPSGGDVRLRLLDRQLGFRHSPESVVSKGSYSPALIVRQMVVPLLRLVRDAEAPIFRGSANALLLEKMQFLLAVSLEALTSHPDHVQLFGAILTFLKPLMAAAAADQPLTRPLHKALIITLSTAISTWPEAIPVLEVLPQLVSAVKYLEAILDPSPESIAHALTADDDELLFLAADALTKIQKLGDPARLARAVVDSSAQEISLLHSTTPKPASLHYHQHHHIQ